ncbi:MAG: LamG-like jellyroll fold domain-containing protein, partial [Bacteroidota bacterium]
MIEIYFRKHYATCIILLFLTICSFTGAHGQINLQNGLLACYSFTGNADDGTGHGNNGTINGASLTSDRFGNANSAYTFDGIDDYISIQPNPFLNENYTYSLWVSANSIPSAGIAYRLISIGGPAGDQNVDLSNNYFGTTGWDGGGYDINSPASITAVSTGSLPNKDVWFHILVTRDVANVKLYINGQIFGTSSTGGRLPYYGNRTKIGATIGGRSVVNQFAHAKLDDIRIYDRALSTDEVTELYTNPPICEPAHDLQLGLLACYSFSGNANDGSGNGKNGTVNGATLTVDRFGNANSAYSFDGNNDHISIPPNNLQNNNYTYSLWANVSAFPSDGETFRMLSIGGPGGDQDVSLSNSYVNTSKGWDGAGYNIGGSVTNYSVGSLPTLNTWNYITVTRDNSSIKLYINGQLAGSASTNGLNPYYGNGLVQAIIGSRSTLVQPFNGAIDDIRIYNRALSATEVTELYTHPSTCEPAPDLQQGLLACYPFTGNANDLSGTGNNGTVKGATLTTDRFGNLNSAYSFDGIDDQINISPNNLLNNNYTYSVWGKASSIPAAQSAGVLFSVGQSGGDQGVSLNNVYLGANTSVGWVGGGINQNSQYTAAVAGSLPNVNTWYHITVTRTNFSASLFVNGQLVSTALSNSSLPRYTINGAQGRIGTRSNEIQFFNGAIDDIRIYNRALSTAEVTLLYNAPNIGNISIQASNLTPCAKEEVTFTVSPSIGGDAQYQWKVDGVNQGSLSASTTFTYTFPNNSPVYTATVGVDVSSEANCISASTQTMVTVTPSLVPSVVLSADKANPCAEEEVTFTAMPTNGGLLPLYQWKIDGVNQGAASTDATFSHTFANAAQAYTKAVSVELTSNLACVSPTQGSGQMSIPVKPLLVSALSVTPSNLSPCGGKEVSFTASPTIGGDAQYQWKVDGVNTGGLSSSPVFLYTFANTSQAYTATVSVEASSNTRCGLPTGQSTLAVTPSPVPSVTVIADNYKPCQGAVVLFTATPTNGGSSPLYQWQMDGVNQGTESGNATFSHIFTTTAQAYTSIVSVVMTSNAVCASPTQGSAQASVAIDPTAIPSVIVMDVLAASMRAMKSTFGWV